MPYSEQNRLALKAWKKVQKRAGPGRRSLWTREMANAAADGPHYDRGELLPIGIMPPTPRHAQTPEAEAARETVRQVARAKLRGDLRELDIVTTLPPRWREVPAELTVGAPAAFIAKVSALGATVRVAMAGTAVIVVVQHPRIRATWKNGRTIGASWADGKLTIAAALKAIADARG